MTVAADSEQEDFDIHYHCQGMEGTTRIMYVAFDEANPDDSVAVGTPICYESIYGEFVTGFVRNGANLLFIMTNDGWWKDTPGYRQHAMYARLRAIENRRSIARSANTGISYLINQKGEILDSRAWWIEDAFRGKIQANNKLSFYSRFGDYLGRISLFVSAIKPPVQKNRPEYTQKSNGCTQQQPGPDYNANQGVNHEHPESRPLYK